jgi:hypothetical protein
VSVRNQIIPKQHTNEPRQIDLGEILRAIALFADPDHLVELRAIPPGKGRFLEPNNAEVIAEVANELARGAGLYVGVNPRRGNARGSNGCGTNANVPSRRWIVFDFDPVRPKNTSATEEQREAARTVALGATAWLSSLGWPTAGALVDSGNGCHVWYRINEANDIASTELVRRCISSVSRQVSTENVIADTSISDPARVIRLPGSMNRKGEIHRLCRLICSAKCADDVGIVSREQLEVVAAMFQQPTRNTPLAEPQVVWSAPSNADVEKRVRAYLERCEPAISGQGGSAQAMRALRQIWGGFDLSREQAKCFFMTHYNPRCEPSWSEKEIDHKLDAIEKEPDQKPRGYLLGDRAHSAKQTQSSEDSRMERDNSTSAGVPWPELIPLSEESEVASFPVDVFPRQIRDLLFGISEAMNCPLDYPGVIVLALAAGAIANSRVIEIKSGYQESAIIFAAYVGRPGSAKSPPLKLLRKPFDRIEQRWREEDSTKIEQWLTRDDETRGAKPGRRQLVLGDVTSEELALQLQQNERGATMPLDELSALFARMNSYRNGVGADRQFLLSIWSQDPIRVNRKGDRATGSPGVYVPKPFLSIVGGIQPDLVASIRGDQSRGKHPLDDGGLDRFLLSWPGGRPARGETFQSVDSRLLDDWSALIEYLLGLEGDADENGRMCPVVVRLGDDGREAYRLWSASHADEINDEAFPDCLRGSWTKLNAYMARLMLVVHEVRRAFPIEGNQQPIAEQFIDANTVSVAARLVGYFKSHARKVHCCMGESEAMRAAAKIAEWVKRHQLSTFTTRDAYRQFGGANRTADYVEEPLKILEKRGVIRPSGVDGQPKSGQRSSPTLQVNPRFLDL